MKASKNEVKDPFCEAEHNFYNQIIVQAGVAELADAQDLGSCAHLSVQVQLLSPALVRVQLYRFILNEIKIHLPVDSSSQNHK